VPTGWTTDVPAGPAIGGRRDVLALWDTVEERLTTRARRFEGRVLLRATSWELTVATDLQR
jgi:hypothetical protein